MTLSDHTPQFHQPIHLFKPLLYCPLCRWQKPCGAMGYKCKYYVTRSTALEMDYILKQECIPVGCVLGRSLTVWRGGASFPACTASFLGGCFLPSRHCFLPGGCFLPSMYCFLPRGVLPSQHALLPSPGGVLPSQHALLHSQHWGRPPPWTESQTRVKT